MKEICREQSLRKSAIAGIVQGRVSPAVWTKYGEYIMNKKKKG